MAKCCLFSFVVILAICRHRALSFHLSVSAAVNRNSQQKGGRTPIERAPLSRHQTILQDPHHRRHILLLSDQDGDRSNNFVTQQQQDTDDAFDGKGLIGYLAPYALALAGSLLVTALFVKFVLLDY